jgi:hypothetical protein
MSSTPVTQDLSRSEKGGFHALQLGFVRLSWKNGEKRFDKAVHGEN